MRRQQRPAWRRAQVASAQECNSWRRTPASIFCASLENPILSCRPLCPLEVARRAAKHFYFPSRLKKPSGTAFPGRRTEIFHGGPSLSSRPLCSKSMLSIPETKLCFLNIPNVTDVTTPEYEPDPANFCNSAATGRDLPATRRKKHASSLRRRRAN